MFLTFFRKLYRKIFSHKTLNFSLGKTLRNLLKKGVDNKTLEQVERTFFEADLGTEMSIQLLKKVKEKDSLTVDDIFKDIDAFLIENLRNYSRELRFSENSNPTVILVVGVNGTGKTTSVAKLAHYYKGLGKKVLVAAADTFRAAATEQLAIWAGLAKADIVKGSGDPSAVVYDAISAAKARGADIVIVDTAGRLHTKTHLMQELEKIQRVCKKLVPEAPHETLFVIDATLGQNAVDQAKIFNDFVPLTGMILTKLDGTAKGGIVVSLQQRLNIPVQFIGVGEGINDLKPFDIKQFVSDLLN